jgi:hypothetical protein
MSGQETGVRLAVMEDDTALCADCLHELQRESACETAATIVHAWLADPAGGEACRYCGAPDEEART